MTIFAETSPTVKTALTGAAAGAAVLAILGFTFGGWMTGGTAAKLAAQQANTAVVVALAPVCVNNFKLQPDASVQLAAFQALSGSDRTSFVEKGGWATTLGGKDNSSAITRACADSIALLKAADL